jgi:hypothetical protein
MGVDEGENSKRCPGLEKPDCDWNRREYQQGFFTEQKERW